MKRRTQPMIIFFISTLFYVACSKDASLIEKSFQTPKAFGVWNDFSLSEPIIVDQSGVDMQGYWPDGKISAVKEEGSEKFVLYWAENYSFRTEGNTPFPEDQIDQLRPQNRVFGVGFNQISDFTDAGSWFIGVHRLIDGRLAGFFHAESRWGSLTAFKSIGIAYSSDNGRTWTKGEKILNVNYTKPREARWSGLGDGCVVYNEDRQQFICYYSANIEGEDYKICMAASDDPYGSPDTWKKWDGRNFTIDGYDSETGIGGVDHKLAGLTSQAGANPSVMWNDFLKRWVMVYAGWNGVLYMSSSVDGITWEQPLAISKNAEETAGYPNLISEYGDLEGSKVVRLYYARNQNAAGVRQFAYRTITYNEID
ncbi:MAG: hypothetical protein EAS52_04985 [Parapedobacter sp.]|nr:MAG: hypothetical protein EAS52_04985 [Parapedobacter sp.]